MKTSKNNLIVTLADKNYLEFAKALFSSVYFNSGWQGDYMLLAHDVADEDLTWFKDKGIIIYHCRPLADKILGHWPVTIMSKFYLFKPEFKKWKKIIYLDADLFAMSSLDTLLDQNKIAGLGSRKYSFFSHIKLGHYLKEYKRYPETYQKYKQKLKKYSPDIPMFCSGLLVIDTTIIDDQTFSNLLSMMNDFPGAVEEIILSIYFANQWNELPFTACLQYSCLRDRLVKSDDVKCLCGNFFSRQKPIYYCHSIYIQWKNLLNKADEIDLKKRQKADNRWSLDEITKHDRRLKRRLILSTPKLFVHRQIGLYIRILRKISPDIYYFLLKMKNPATIWFKIKISLDKISGLVGILLKNKYPKIYLKLRSLLFPNKVMISALDQDSPEAYYLESFNTPDEAGVINIISKILTPIDYYGWYWKYKKCPTGSLILVAKNKEKEVVGHFGAIAQKIKYYSSEKIVYQIADVGIEKRYRNQGFLKNCFVLMAQRGDFLPWGFVTEKMKQKYDRAIPLANSNHPNTVIESNILIKRLSPLLWFKRQTFRQLNQGFSIQNDMPKEVETIIDQLWKEKESEIKVGCIRNWEFVKWRIVDSPFGMKLFLIKDVHQKVIGYFAIQDDKSTVLISDFVILNSYLDLALLKIIESFLFKIGYRNIQIVTTDVKLLSILHENDYKKFPGFNFIYNDFVDKINPQDIYLTLVDADWSLID